MCDKTYSLGEDFEVEPTSVHVTVTHQNGDDPDNLVKEITEIRNDSHVDLAYWKWSDAGVMGDDPLVKPADAHDEVNVKTISLPRVSIVKSVASPDTGLNSTVTFTIEITNLASSEENFKNPIALDILPTGVTYDNRDRVHHGRRDEGHQHA